MDVARVYAARSKDPATRVGAVIVGPDKEQRSAGYNGICRGVSDEPKYRHERPAKYLWYSHAELNAITNAARVGIPLDKCSLYVVARGKKLTPCTDCARAIIQSGIREVVTITEASGVPKRYREDMSVAWEMMLEAGIKLRTTNKTQ